MYELNRDDRKVPSERPALDFERVCRAAAVGSAIQPVTRETFGVGLGEGDVEYANQVASSEKIEQTSLSSTTSG
jgi:hypothetical protein